MSLALIFNLIAIHGVNKYHSPFRCEAIPLPRMWTMLQSALSMEGHQRKIHQAILDYAPKQRREALRVCELCGFSCSKFSTLLHHTESLHPLAFDVIAQLRRRTLRPLNWLPTTFILFYLCYNNRDPPFGSSHECCAKGSFFKHFFSVYGSWTSKAAFSSFQ